MYWLFRTGHVLVVLNQQIEKFVPFTNHLEYAFMMTKDNLIVWSVFVCDKNSKSN